MNTLDDQWKSYKKMVIPEGATETQVTETKRAFYAGATAILNVQYLIGDASNSREAQEGMIQGIVEECRDFHENVSKGLA
jgi:hypothetical protein